MKSAPITVNESRSMNEWQALQFTSSATDSWNSKQLEEVDTIFGISPSFLSLNALKRFFRAMVDLTKEQGMALLSLSTDKLWKRRMIGVSESIGLGASFQDISTSVHGFYVFRDTSVRGKIVNKEATKVHATLNIPAPYCLQKYESDNAVPVRSLPKAVDRVRLPDTPDENLSNRQRAGALSAEASSLLEAGFWEYSVETEAFFCTEYVYELLGIPASITLEDFDSFMPFLTKESQVRLAQAWDNLIIDGEELNCLVEVPSGDDSSWLRVKGKAVVKNAKVSKLVGAIQNVTEHVEKERALMAEKVVAEHATQRKAEFISYMSHEIRTPLNAIMGLTYLLLQENGLKEEHKQNLNSIHFSSQNLLALINNTLDYSKMEAGKVELEKVNFHLKDLLKNTHQALCLRSMEKRINFDLAIDPRTPAEVAGDPVRLMQILNNLLSNAIKFTEHGSVKLGVDVVYQNSQEWVLDFTVSDTGIGIPVDKQSSIFESFTQASTSTHRQYGGTGLGLSITKNLVDLHKGAIQLKSVPGEGSSFSVRLRFVKPQSSLVTLPKIGGNKIPCTKLRGVKILVVDDNDINKTVATKLLTNWHAEVETADDGLSALSKIDSTKYDLVLMDLYMPHLDGFQTVSRLREAGYSLPVIALTANASEEERKRILEAGVNDYLTKPFVPQDLFNKVLQHVNSKKVLAKT
ncbi:response regulator [Rufibacter sp. XAAS-G3-1]|uniref:response regulator n=1 Tax=Rufibacter sp. XAAS-G3-1 TaxID=2729134 RepID=UPI0015E6BE94|nr:response regulator [Rufibacter sp. XAAS-G3-1]